MEKGLEKLWGECKKKNLNCLEETISRNVDINGSACEDSGGSENLN